MSTFKEFRNNLKKRIPSNIDGNIYRIHTTRLESIFADAEQYFNLPSEEIRFEIESVTDTIIIKHPEYSILAYPISHYVYIDEETNMLKNINGEFFIRRGKGVLYLMVTPAEEGGKPVSYNDVVHLINHTYAQFEDSIDNNQIKKIVEKQSSGWVQISKFDYLGSNDAEISIKVGKGDMVANVYLKPAEKGGADVTASDILHAIDHEGIIYGIKEPLIERLEKKPIYNQWIEIAVGDEPEDGENAKIVITPDKLKKDSKKSSLYKKHDVGLLKTVHKGNVVAIKKTLTQGKEGRTIFGEILFSNPGNDITMEGNSNVVISNDNKKAIAKVDGSVYVKGNRVFVDKLWVIQGNLTMEIGDIDFPGSVMIQGSVPIDVKINVEGNLSIIGSVGNAAITVGGDLFIANGMHGKGNGSIDVKGSLVSRFLENINVKVGNICLIEDSIINSNILCLNKVIVVEGKGQITSSSITAEKEILVKSVGAELGIPTDLKVVSFAEDRKKLEVLHLKKTNLKEDIVRQKGFFGSHISTNQFNAMNVQQKLQIKEKLVLLKKTQLAFKKVNSMIGFIQQKLKSNSAKTKISILNRIRSGTKIIFDNKSTVLRSDSKGVVYTFKNDEIINTTFVNSKDGISQTAIDKIIHNVQL